MNVKAIGCTDCDLSLSSGCKCILKPTRNGHGKISGTLYNLKPLSDIWIHFLLFYRFRTKFRQWQVNYDIDYCALHEGNFHMIPFMWRFFKEMKKQVPIMEDKCPLQGNLTGKNIDVAQAFENTIPQVLPRGTYKFTARVYSKMSNKTIANIWFIAEIKAINVLQNFEMGK